MPARSNDFQKLVLLIQHHVADGGQVDESVMVESLTGGPPREVDVVVRTGAGEHQAVLAVEACKLTRKATVEWIERMVGKHRDLKTDKLILYSGSGFTAGALRRAGLENVQTVEARTLESSEGFEAVFGAKSNASGDTYWRALIIRVGYTEARWSARSADGAVRIIDMVATEDLPLMRSDGQPLGASLSHALEVVPRLHRRSILKSIEDLNDVTTRAAFERWKTFPPPGLRQPDGTSLTPWVLHSTPRQEQELLLLEKIKLHLLVRAELFETTEVTYKRAGDTAVAQIKGEALGESFVMLTSMDPGGKRLTAQFGTQPPESLRWAPEAN